MGQSKSSNDGILFIKYRKIDHGKSIDFFPYKDAGDEWLYIP